MTFPDGRILNLPQELIPVETDADRLRANVIRLYDEFHRMDIKELARRARENEALARFRLIAELNKMLLRTNISSLDVPIDYSEFVR